MSFLRNSFSSQDWCCIYSDPNNAQRFIYGVIYAFDDNFCAIRMRAPSGEEDGILAKPIHTIFRIETNSQYCRKMQILSACVSEVAPPKIDTQDGIISSLLKHAMREKALVSIELNDSGCDDIIGIPINVSYENCIVMQYDNYGKRDGMSNIDINAITQLCYNSSSEQIISRLLNNGNIGDTEGKQGTV